MNMERISEEANEKKRLENVGVNCTNMGGFLLLIQKP